MTECDACRTIATMMMPTGRCTAYKPLQLKVVESLEEVLVVNLELTVLQSLVLNPYVLVVVLYLVSMWVQTAVGSNDTITVKVMVGSRIASVVATVCKNLLTCNLALVAQSLVNKVPDVATLIFGVLTDDVPILFESAHRVTHGVGILTLYQRTWIVALGIFLAVLVTHIHRTEDIGLAVVACLLKLAWTGVVISLHPVVCLLKVWSVSSLVTQAPYDD